MDPIAELALHFPHFIISWNPFTAPLELIVFNILFIVSLFWECLLFLAPANLASPHNATDLAALSSGKYFLFLCTFYWWTRRWRKCPLCSSLLLLDHSFPKHIWLSCHQIITTRLYKLILKYWVDQKVHSGFSVDVTENWNKYFGQPGSISGRTKAKKHYPSMLYENRVALLLISRENVGKTLLQQNPWTTKSYTTVLINLITSYLIHLTQRSYKGNLKINYGLA